MDRKVFVAGVLELAGQRAVHVAGYKDDVLDFFQAYMFEYLVALLGKTLPGIQAALVAVLGVGIKHDGCHDELDAGAAGLQPF
ncbi:hypothetical protein D3C81_1759700 [compost metagenome]